MHQAPEDLKRVSQSLHLFFDGTQDVAAGSEMQLREKLEAYLLKLNRIKVHTKSDERFLKKMFFRTHRNYLHRYTARATFPETLNSGTYGCLSGTALYAIILDHFGYNFEIVEMPSHVYLKVHLPEKTLLIESTLPQEGFIANVSKIAKATQQYADKSRINNSILTVGSIDDAAASKVYFTRSINLTQLSGLQFYNTAIYNLGDEAYDLAFLNAQKAVDLYPSKRTDKLMEIVINKILQNKNLTKDQKSGILNAYISQVKKKKLTQR